MKRHLINLALKGFLIFAFMGACSALAGDLYSQTKFPVPHLDGAKAYLGLLEDQKDFTLTEINAEVIIVEVFSMDCPICQRSVKKYNKLYELIRQKGLNDKIKIIGIGIGNSELEMKLFQKKYEAIFPLSSDPDSKSYRMVGHVRIPYIMVFKKDADGVLKKIYSNEREPKDAEPLLKDILAMAGLSQ